MSAEVPQRLVARRIVLLSGLAGLTGAGLAACSGSSAGSPLLAPLASTPTPTPTPTLPPVPGYAVLPGEVEPAVKQAAVDFVEAALTAPPGDQGAVAGLDARLTAAGVSPEAATPLRSLLPAAGPSAVRVVYPQYGGLTKEVDRASIMMVAERLFLDDTGPEAGLVVATGPLTVDIRLSRSGGSWAVTEVIPATSPALAPSVSELARSVLDEDRIRLPGAARADVLAGTVDDRVLGALLALAERWTVDVLVLASGHPTNVFNTDRVSNHTLGRAVDIWALDGIPVIDQARAPWKDAMNAAAAAGATEVGGPMDPDVRPFFSDAVHQDHLHIGFDGP